MPGESIIVSKDIPGYLSSTEMKSSTTVAKGSYYIYKYVENVVHEVNLSKDAKSPGSWVDAQNITLI